MKLKLTPDEMTTLVPNIVNVLKTGRAWKDDAMHHPAGAIIDAVLGIKGMEKFEDDDSSNGEGFDTNGWEWDWSQDFTYSGKNYTLSGSGYNGGHSFQLSDE